MTSERQIILMQIPLVHHSVSIVASVSNTDWAKLRRRNEITLDRKACCLPVFGSPTTAPRPFKQGDSSATIAHILPPHKYWCTQLLTMTLNHANVFTAFKGQLLAPVNFLELASVSFPLNF